MQKRKIIILTIVLITLILGLIIFWLITKDNTKKYYSDKSQMVIKEFKIKEIYQEEYSKTLDKMLQSKYFDITYLEEYKVIKYQDKDTFLKDINDYLIIGYSGKEINDIFKLSAKNQAKIKELEKTDFSKYLNIKNFDILKISRYEEYLKKTKKDIQTVVTYVNINLDKEFYTDTTPLSNPDDLAVIINKYYYVEKNFVPKDLVVLFDSKQNAKMVKVAADAFKDLIKAAEKDGLTLESTTAYRSYSFQNTLYTNYVKEDGVKLADTYSARPGTSEHQLGLAVDLNNPNVSGKRLSDSDYEWLKENAHKYGFIIRYTKEGVPITGYMEEPWHIRYLGIDLATKVTNSGLTYEEYYDLYMMEY